MAEFLLHDCFEAQVLRTPDGVALREGARSISYAELGEGSARVARALRSRGIRGGGFVGLHIERSIDYVTSVLGVLKANCAVVPLPPSYPEARLRDVLSFAGLDAVVDDERTPLKGPVDSVFRFSGLLADFGEPRGDTEPASPDQTAFVLCSSGSTGTPKMIARSHRSFFHRLQWTWDHHPYGAGEVCCQKSFMTTTHAIYELFEPLLRGVPVMILSDEEVRDLGGFWETIARTGISRLLIVPSLLQASLDLPGFVAPAINVMVLMGEYVHPKLAQRAITTFPLATRIYSIYGSTEASSTLVCDLRESLREGEELPLGKPISSDVRAHVLDTELGPVEPGAVGMLHIEGAALFEGYFKDPALTASAWAQPPNGPRLFNTRDQVRLREDGSLLFVGRIDHTVKIRGFRVDLQEVERVLLQHPDVRHGAVVAAQDDTGASMLLGFYAPAGADQGSVFAVLREKLPSYMVPSVLMGLDAIPRTPGGKIDRRKLLEHADRTATTAPTGRALTETEARVAAVWKGVLKHGAIRRDSRFFEIGGTSLSVFAALHRLRQAFGLDRSQLSDQALYQFPTLDGLARHIDALKSGTAATAAAADTILVTLKGGDASRPPFFVISSAGGTLGAYQKLAKVLTTRREVVGVRDPFVWGERNLTMGLRAWVKLYADAIRARQPEGPYSIGAYSSAAVLGYEIARHLRREGQEVALLALIDPWGMDSKVWSRFGYWASKARLGNPALRRAVMLAGRLRQAVPGPWRKGRTGPQSDGGLTAEQLGQLSARAKTNKSHILSLSALLEINTGLPFALDRKALSSLEPSQYLGALLEKIRSVAPEIDPQSIANIVVQYYIQARAQQTTRLQPFDGEVVILEVAGAHSGLFAAQFAPYVGSLRVFAIKVGRWDDRTTEVAGHFGPSIRSHYMSMRDDVFVKGLAEELDRLLADQRPASQPRRL